MGYLRFLATNPRFLSFGFGLNVFLALGQTFYVSLYNTDIREALLLSHGELAALYGTATIFGSVFVLGLGRFLDHVDLRIFTCATTIAVAFGCYMFSQATTIIGLFVAVFIIRFTAQGLWGVSAQVSTARYFDSERGKAVAVANTGYALGYAVFPLIGAWLLATYGWREAWSVSGWFVLLIILPLTMFQLWGHGERHRKYEEKLSALADGPRETRVHQWTLSQVLKDVRFWLIQPAMIAVPAIVFSIQFHQLYLVETKAWDLTVFAGGYTLYSGMSLLATLVGGSFIDKYGSRGLISFYLWPLIPALLALGLSSDPFIIIVLMGLTGFTFGLSLLVYVTLWAEMYGTKHMGAIRSFNVFFNVSIASSVMVLTGWLIDQDVSVATMCFGGIAFVLLSLALLIVMKRITATVPHAAD
ncbi:MAG: MFS transporter [Rhodospirillaceae bacterium]|nr:MFS transporter [Rhodospirillaceae bacterium]